MLKQAQNDLLTQTGPGTPWGQFLRSYWQPIAASEEMPVGGAPIPIRIMSEDPGLIRDPANAQFSDFICTSGHIEDDEDGPSYCRRVLGAKPRRSRISFSDNCLRNHQLKSVMNLRPLLTCLATYILLPGALSIVV